MVDYCDASEIKELYFDLDNVKSSYNEDYYCNVLSVRVANKIDYKEIHVEIDMKGNMSLGQIQDPTKSELFLNNKSLTFLDKEFTKEDQCYGYEGLLKYRADNDEFGALTFQFGECGYTTAYLLDL